MYNICYVRFVSCVGTKLVTTFLNEIIKTLGLLKKFMVIFK